MISINMNTWIFSLIILGAIIVNVFVNCFVYYIAQHALAKKIHDEMNKSPVERSLEKSKYYELCRASHLEKALDIMDRFIKKFNQQHYLSIADYYDGFGEPCEFIDTCYGWDNLSENEIHVERESDGYYHIKMPKPVVLKGGQ